MRKLIIAGLAAALIAPVAWAQTPPGPAGADPAPAPAAAEAKPDEPKPGLVDAAGGVVGGILGTAAGAAGGPLGSAAGGVAGNRVGRGTVGLFKRMFGGGKKKTEMAIAAAAPAASAEAVATAPRFTTPLTADVNLVAEVAVPASVEPPTPPIEPMIS
ncbi:hypothetical protein [Phenylobacterium sp.]|uniref:hypothetical protein n=1 Tax=Phenylobacterium sp. TaxID=1871053 RepID=UPI003983D11C